MKTTDLFLYCLFTVKCIMSYFIYIQIIFCLEVNLEIINKLQNKCIRIMNFSGFREHTNNLLITDKVVKFSNIIITNQIMLIHHFNKTLVATDLHNLFSHSINSHNYNTRMSSNHGPKH